MVERVVGGREIRTYAVMAGGAALCGGPASAASPLPGSACRVAPWRLPETPGLGLGLLRVAENGAIAFLY